MHSRVSCDKGNLQVKTGRVKPRPSASLHWRGVIGAVALRTRNHRTWGSRNVQGTGLRLFQAQHLMFKFNSMPLPLLSKVAS